MRQIALTALTIISLCVTAQAVILDDVPYNTPMWSDGDPFGFGAMNVVTADVSKIRGDIVVITNDVEVLKLYGPRITGLEGRTNDWNTITFKPVESGNIVSIVSGSGATLFDAVLIGDRAGDSVVAGSVIAIGRDALRRFNSGKTPEALGNDRSLIVAIGENAGEDAHTTISAVAIGADALQEGSARFSTAIGTSAGKRGSLYDSVAIGTEAGSHQAELEHATVIGGEAGRGAVGAHITAMGYAAARGYTGTNVVAIGAGTGKNAAGNNKLLIDSSGVNDGADAHLSMIYGDGVDLTLGRVGSSNTLRGNWSMGGHDLATTDYIDAALVDYVLGSQIPDYLRNLPAVTNWSFSASGANKLMTFSSQTGLLFSDTAENISYSLNCFGLTMLPDNGGDRVSFKLDGLRVNDTLYGYPSGISSDIATKADIATAVAGLDPEEHDLKALRLYHYGDPDIVESPAEWFTFAGGVITGFNYQAGREHVVIPWEIDGQAVVGIGNSAFAEVQYIQTVKAPRTLVGISNLAFNSCYSLTSVNLPQATTIGNDAFSGCESLTSVNLPQATTIGNQAFNYCYSLTSVNLPQATTVSDYAFYSCYYLTSVNLPQATTVSDYAFYYCDSLTSITIGSATKPTFGTGWNQGTHPNLKIYVTNPYATGWDGITEVDGTPVVRVVNTDMIEDLIPDVDLTELTDPYQPWTSTIVPVNGTATVVRAHGLYPKLELSGKTVIAIDSDTYPTGGTSAVKLSLFAGANEVELNEENVMYAEPIEISDTEWTTIYFERTSTNTWRAVTW